MSEETQIALFMGQEVRRTYHQNEWWFAVADVIAVLTKSKDPGVYWRKLKQRLIAEGSNETVTNCHGLKMLAKDGKLRVTDSLRTTDLLRLIQSIPSPKAEPFKRWLAKVGYERLQEIEDPELATKRTRELYKAKGYPEAWIDKRMRGIAARDTLTTEWQNRGVKQAKEYAILTAEISKATFGITPSEYKKLKKLQHQNLRDHMDDLELIFTMLGEASTTEIVQNKDAQGFDQNKEAAQKGGKIAGDARSKLEKQSGRKVVTKANFLPAKQSNRLPKKAK